MEVCHKCGKPADFICPHCSTKSCRTHMELRYLGPYRGFKSRYMCPKCWRTKQVMLNQNMINARRYKPKPYVFYKVPIIGR